MKDQATVIRIRKEAIGIEIHNIREMLEICCPSKEQAHKNRLSNLLAELRSLPY